MAWPKGKPRSAAQNEKSSRAARRNSYQKWRADEAHRSALERGATPQEARQEAKKARQTGRTEWEQRYGINPPSFGDDGGAGFGG